MNHKTIKIELKDPQLNKRPVLRKYECENILNNARIDVSLEDALNVLIQFMYITEVPDIVIDIYERNMSLKPAKEMTIEEIEKELGHKIKIVNKEEKE